MQDLDTESQISLLEYRRKGNTWKNNQNFQLEKKEYENLVDFIPSVLSYVVTFKKTCINIDECTDVQKLNEILKNFDLIKHDISSNTKRKNYFPCTCIVLDPNINLKEMDQKFPFGDLIGYGNS